MYVALSIMASAYPGVLHADAWIWMMAQGTYTRAYLSQYLIDRGILHRHRRSCKVPIQLLLTLSFSRDD